MGVKIKHVYFRQYFACLRDLPLDTEHTLNLLHVCGD